MGHAMCVSIKLKYFLLEGGHGRDTGGHGGETYGNMGLNMQFFKFVGGKCILLQVFWVTSAICCHVPGYICVPIVLEIPCPCLYRAT